jgi:tetratricopeptide (TPR) repeat protein
MKCPGCGLYHPPQYENCVSCGSKLKIQEPKNQEVAGAPVVTTERPAISERGASSDRSGGAESSANSQRGGGSDRSARSDRSASFEASASSEQSAGPEESDNSEQLDNSGRRPFYERPTSSERPSLSSEDREFDVSERKPDSLRRSKHVRGGFKSGVPTSLGILLAATVLLVTGGATFFFMTKPPDDQRLLEQGQKELQNGQYAFAVTTLNQALALRKKDPKVYLSLARAYVGVDQVEKAWDCINQAQQLGLGVVAEPALASDLANYYRQRGKYDRAVDLLRPLAQGGIAGKKAELADLDALWGDEALRQGKVDQALKCWEEVRDLREGSRYGEADARLATIYQKMANAAANNNDDAKALVYLSKLNNIAQNSRNYEMASDIYERTGELELAIDQLRRAMKLGARNTVVEKKLSMLLSRRGKELLDQGNSDAGYGYLQQAKEMNGDSKVPEITLRNVETTFDGNSHVPRIDGEVWNPSEKSINSLNLKVELYDNVTSRVIWFKDEKLVDEFVPPLNAKDSKPFDFLAGEPVKANGSAEFRIYLDGTLYKSYPIGKKDRGSSSTVKSDEDVSTPTTSALKPIPVQRPKPKPKPVVQTEQAKADTRIEPSPNPVPTVEPPPVTRGSSSEEKTMKDLEP